MAKLAAVVAVFTGVMIPGGGDAARAAEAKFSPLDSYDPQTHPDYNLDYVGFLQDDDDPNLMNFFLVFKKPVFRTQFADGAGSQAGVLIDADRDGRPDIALATDDRVLPADYSTVPGYAYNYQTYRRLACKVDVGSDYQDGGNILLLQVEKSCLGLPDSFAVQGFAAYGASSSGSKYDFAPASWWFVKIAATQVPPTTVPPAPSVPPAAPTGLTVAHLGSGTVRLGWTDSSNDEEGFLLQRNDTPVPAGTTVDAWPYKIPANTNTHTIPALVNNPQVCFSIASYNKAGASTFTSFVCTSTVETPTATTVVTKPGGSLTCSASWPSKKGSRSVRIVTDPANAGKRLQFEIFNKAKFEPFGSGRVRADGSVVVSVPASIAKLRGSYEIRGTQGSRFICEGTIR